MNSYSLILLIGVLFSGITFASVTLPANIVAYLPITLVNYQSTALAANTPIAISTSNSFSSNIIGFNALAYTRYETCNLNNAEFFYSNGTIIPSWMEGNLLNENAANSICSSGSSANALSSSANVLYWIKIGNNAPSFLPANTGSPTTNTIYLGWAGNVVSAANTLLNVNTVGQAPQLSCSNPYSAPTCNGIYGHYDNGNTIFGFYDNFIGSSLNSNYWTNAGGATLTISNSLEVTGTSQGIWLYGAVSLPIQVTDTDVIAATSGLSQLRLGYSFVGGETVYDGVTNLGFATPSSQFQIESALHGCCGVSTSLPAGLTVPYVQSFGWIGNGQEFAYINYGNKFSNPDSTYSYGSTGYLGLLLTYATSGSFAISLQWIRSRNNPPANIMPATIFGSVDTAMSSSISPTGADSGSPITITSNIIGGTSPYTYNFLVYSNYGLVSNALYTGVPSTSNAFTFLQNSFWGTGTFTVNVIITDSLSGSNSVSQTYTVANGVTSYLPSALPANIISYLPLTLSNSQSFPEPSNTDLMIPINASQYTPYEANGLQNLEFFYSNGTIIPSWLEGNSLNGQQYDSLNTSANIVYWIRIASNTFLPAYSTNTIYLGFGTATANLLNSNLVGEAPSLSSNYGQYDDGANVFALYFNGDTSPSSFNSAPGVSVTQTTGVTYGSETINAINLQGKYNCGCHYYYGVTLSQPFSNTGIVVESNFKNLNTGADQGVASIVDSPTATSVQNAVSVDQGYASTYFSQTYVQGGSVHPDQNGQGSIGGSWLYGTLNYPGSSGTSWSGFVAPQLYSSTGGYYGNLNNNPLSSASQVYIGLIGYLNSGNSNNWNEDLNWMRARVNPINGSQPQASTQQLTISPSNVILDYGQYLTLSVVLQGGTGPFTVELVASNGMTVQTLNSQSDGTILFSTFVPPVGSDSYNAVIIDTATTPEAYFSTDSNTVTVESAPTLLPSLSNTVITIGQNITYTVNIPSSQGVGPFTLNILANGVVLSTNTIPSGSSNTLLYTPGSTGSISFNTVAVDTYTSTPYVFTSTSNALTVNPVVTTTTINPTTSVCSSCIQGSGGSAPSGNPTESTTSVLTTTSATTTQQTTITTSVQIAQPISVTVLPNGQTTPSLCNGLDTGYSITYSSLGSTFGVSPGTPGCFTITATNATSALASNVTIENSSNIKKLLAVNFTISNRNVSVNTTMHYPCNISSAQVAPYILKNGSWVPIVPFTVNSVACTVSFAIPDDPIIGIFETPPATTSIQSTTTAETQQGPSTSFLWAEVFGIVAIILVLLFLVLRNRRNKKR